MYGTSHTGLGALLLLLVALLHKLVSTLHVWATQRTHGLWFHGRHHDWKTKSDLMRSIGHARDEITRLQHLIRQQKR